MRITLTESDLHEMPDALRHSLWAFISGRANCTSSPLAAEKPLDSDFEFSTPPRGSRHPGKKLVSFRNDQAKEFMRTFAAQDSDIDKVLHELACAFCRYHRNEAMPDLSPADLAEYLDLRDEDGATDARRVSPVLKKVTHAIRDYTGDSEAGWYTLDRAGDFYLDPKTESALNRYFEGVHHS